MILSQQLVSGNLTLVPNDLLDRIHRALRGVDAADQSSPIPQDELDRISDAVFDLEGLCRERGVVLSEFKR